MARRLSSVFLVTARYDPTPWADEEVDLFPELFRAVILHEMGHVLGLNAKSLATTRAGDEDGGDVHDDLAPGLAVRPSA